jgi:hypothetical protein
MAESISSLSADTQESDVSLEPADAPFQAEASSMMMSDSLKSSEPEISF